MLTDVVVPLPPRVKALAVLSNVKLPTFDRKLSFVGPGELCVPANIRFAPPLGRADQFPAAEHFPSPAVPFHVALVPTEPCGVRLKSSTARPSSELVTLKS